MILPIYKAYLIKNDGKVESDQKFQKKIDDVVFYERALLKISVYTSYEFRGNVA